MDATFRYRGWEYYVGVQSDFVYCVRLEPGEFSDDDLLFTAFWEPARQCFLEVRPDDPDFPPDDALVQAALEALRRAVKEGLSEQ